MELKKEMVECINSVNYENVDIQKELMEKYWELIQSFKELEAFKAQHPFLFKTSDDKQPHEDRVTDEIGQQADDINDKNESPERKDEKHVLGYRFERKIKDGFVPEIEGFVPEGIIRKLGLEHGDLVSAIPIESDESSRRHFHYELVEKGDGHDAPDRVQVNYCAVHKEAGRLVVDKSEETGEYIRYEEGLYTVILDEYDVQKHYLREGDLIDIAYPVGKPHLSKVLWVHRIEEQEETPLNKESNTAKLKNETVKKEIKNAVVFEQTLEGKTILVIGNEPKRKLYKYSIEQKGGSFLWADAKEKLNRLEPLVRKSDIVVFLLGVSGHVGMEHLKKMCKDHGVIFETTWSKGKSTIIQLAEERVGTSA